MPLPSNPISLKHLLALTTSKGIIQHSRLAKPNPQSGYALDDQARALILACALQNIAPKESKQLTKIYFSSFKNFRHPKKLFQNFYYPHRQRPLQGWIGDSLGQVLWASAVFQNTYPDHPLAAQNTKLWQEIIRHPFLTHFSHPQKNVPQHPFPPFFYPRFQGYLLLALAERQKSTSLSKAEKQIARGLEKTFLKNLRQNQNDNWFWPENFLSYANALIPWALFSAWEISQSPQTLVSAKKTLRFLLVKTTNKNIPAPIGNHGWHFQGKPGALFAQQSIEAGYTCLALLKAFETTHQSIYLQKARQWFRWYSGHNLLKISLIDPHSKGCYDALEASGKNLNQGAESIICYLLAAIFLAKYRQNPEP